MSPRGSPSEPPAGGDPRIAPTPHLSTLTHLPPRRRSPLPGPRGPAPLLWRGQWDPGAGLAEAAPADCAGRSASAAAAPPAGTRAAIGRSPAHAATGDLPGVGRPGAESFPTPAWPLIISSSPPDRFGCAGKCVSSHAYMVGRISMSMKPHAPGSWAKAFTATRSLGARSVPELC